MAQRSVELVIGRLLTDEQFRQLFEEESVAAIDTLIADGLSLNAVERDALLKIDMAACHRFAESLDPRLQKVRLRRSRL
jgi:hypothetical protein